MADGLGVFDVEPVGLQDGRRIPVDVGSKSFSNRTDCVMKRCDGWVVGANAFQQHRLAVVRENPVKLPDGDRQVRNTAERHVRDHTIELIRLEPQ